MKTHFDYPLMITRNHYKYKSYTLQMCNMIYKDNGSEVCIWILHNWLNDLQLCINWYYHLIENVFLFLNHPYQGCIGIAIHMRNVYTAIKAEGYIHSSLQPTWKKKESEKRTRQRAKSVSTSGSVSSVASSRSSMRSGTSAASSLSGRSASSRMSSSRGRGRGSRGRGR